MQYNNAKWTKEETEVGGWVFPWYDFYDEWNRVWSCGRSSNIQYGEIDMAKSIYRYIKP